MRTFRYFYDFAHPVSRLARERTTTPDTCAIGGSGFGVMALIAATERGFVTRDEAVAHLKQMLDFLLTADRFHGCFPHWMNGNTGRVIPFGADDDGGDLVETAFMMQGLLAAREYFSHDSPAEQHIRAVIERLWREVEWDWYTQGKNELYWHWSPRIGFQKNLAIRGWNEALIVYILAASSPTHPIDAEVYRNGWAQHGQLQSGEDFEGVRLPLGTPWGGPLFFTHYSFLGLDPRGLKDRYADYWEQNCAHARINYRYCVRNPKEFAGYGPNCWGLTASDSVKGYDAHSPTNDLGVISPTAALASFPYTPEESMRALRHFYQDLGGRIWGKFGFKDAFSISANWTAEGYLAIDQGPIVVMIENYRSGLLWRLFMANPEVHAGLRSLGFR